MKFRPLHPLFLTLIIVTISFSFMKAQNTPPTVTNVSISVDEPSQTATITYDLADADNGTAEVWLRVSADAGETYLVPVENTSGDIGAGVTVGTGKTITWDFSQTDFSGYFEGTLFTAQVVADDGFEINIQDLVDQVDSNRLKSDLESIVGVRHYSSNPTKLAETRDFIKDNFGNNGLPFTTQEVPFAGPNGENIIARQQGFSDETQTYIVDGHFDTVSNSPGADDNGSAVVGMLEVMRILAPYSFGKTIRYIGFDLEEEGLLGSAAYVVNAIPEYESLQGAYNFEMIGFYSDQPNTQTLPTGFELLFPDAVAAIEADDFRGNFITNVSDVNSNSLATVFENAAMNYVPELKVITLVTPNAALTPDLLRSDHASFWFSGYKALMLTDGANFRNFNYHQPTDVISTINFEFMVNVVKATVGAVAESAEIRNIGAGESAVFELPGLPVTTQKAGAQEATIVLGPNFPNPVNHHTTIPVFLPEACSVELNILDANGSVVVRLHSGALSAGKHNFEWHKEENPNGLYLVRLNARLKDGSERALVKKLLVIDKHKH